VKKKKKKKKKKLNKKKKIKNKKKKKKKKKKNFSRSWKHDLFYLIILKKDLCNYTNNTFMNIKNKVYTLLRVQNNYF